VPRCLSTCGTCGYLQVLALMLDRPDDGDEFLRQYTTKVAPRPANMIRLGAPRRGIEWCVRLLRSRLGAASTR